MPTTTSDVYIDHLTILLGKEDFESLPAWLTDNFTILDGGDHTGRASRIKLIAFKDGTYIELFSWIGTPPSDHPWGVREPGILDFALSVGLPSTAVSNRKRLVDAISRENGDGQLGVRYGELKPGGRTTPAGVHLAWETLHPEYFSGPKSPDTSYIPQGRLEAPFWCHDKTERHLRTPFDDPQKTTHPSGATGIAQVDILVPNFLLNEYTQLYRTVTGSQSETAEKDTPGNFIYTRSPVSKNDRQSIRIHVPQDSDEVSWLKERGIGLAGLSININGKGGHESKKLSSTGTGSRITLNK